MANELDERLLGHNVAHGQALLVRNVHARVSSNESAGNLRHLPLQSHVQVRLAVHELVQCRVASCLVSRRHSSGQRWPRDALLLQEQLRDGRVIAASSHDVNGQRRLAADVDGAGVGADREQELDHLGRIVARRAGGEVQRRVGVAVAGVHVLFGSRQLGQSLKHVDVALAHGDVEGALQVLALSQLQDAGGRAE